MSDDTTTLDDADLDIRTLREQAAHAAKVNDENADLKKQLLFAKVGVDTDSTLGKMLLKSFDGASEDDLRKLAIEVGAIKVSPPPADEQHPDAGQQQFREQAQGGLAPSADPGPDPWEAGLIKFHAERRKGVAVEVAQHNLAASILRAANTGDKRVLLDRGAWARAAEEADRMAML